MHSTRCHQSEKELFDETPANSEPETVFDSVFVECLR